MMNKDFIETDIDSGSNNVNINVLANKNYIKKRSTILSIKDNNSIERKIIISQDVINVGWYTLPYRDNKDIKLYITSGSLKDYIFISGSNKVPEIIDNINNECIIHFTDETVFNFITGKLLDIERFSFYLTTIKIANLLSGTTDYINISDDIDNKEYTINIKRDKFLEAITKAEKLDSYYNHLDNILDPGINNNIEFDFNVLGDDEFKFNFVNTVYTIK